MEPSEVQRAADAAGATASALGLPVDDAVAIHNSNRVAVHVTPCGVLARVAPLPQRSGAEFELEVARQLVETGSPVATLEPRVEPRVYVEDAFAITLWTYYEPRAPTDITPAEYANALGQLHAGLRRIELRAPHFTDRV